MSGIGESGHRALKPDLPPPVLTRRSGNESRQCSDCRQSTADAKLTLSAPKRPLNPVTCRRANYLQLGTSDEISLVGIERRWTPVFAEMANAGSFLPSSSQPPASKRSERTPA
jgi:hypothetical protein